MGAGSRWTTGITSRGIDFNWLGGCPAWAAGHCRSVGEYGEPCSLLVSTTAGNLAGA
jgi:hypothetical protein